MLLLHTLRRLPGFNQFPLLPAARTPCMRYSCFLDSYLHHRHHSTQSRRREQMLQHDCLVTGPCKEAGWEQTEINTGWEWPLLQVLWHLRIHTTAIYVCASPPNVQPNRECLFHFHNHLATCDICPVYTMT